MRPAFSSTKQATAFALLLLLLLAAPWLAGKNWLPPREQAYASEGWLWGPYAWIQNQIFEETNAIDIAFIGSSKMLFGINTPYVEQKLDERLGRKTVVRTIGWGGPGFDSIYFVVKDLLEHRQVKTIVFSDENTGLHPNRESPHWFRFGDDPGVLSGLPLRDKSVFYFAAIIGMPANLLELLTPNLPEDTNHPGAIFHQLYTYTDNPETRLGSTRARFIFDPPDGQNPHFIPFIPTNNVTPADVCIYSTLTASNFVFSNQPLPAWQIHFAEKFSSLAKSHGCRLIFLHIPTFEERDSPVMVESRYWPEYLQTQVEMAGIPARRLFAGLSPRETELLFMNPGHLNQNGQAYFTALITPALLDAYENQPNH